MSKRTCLLFLTLAVLCVIVPVGSGAQAQAKKEKLAAAMGVNIAYHKLLAFALSAFFAGLAGSLFAHYLSFVTPNMLIGPNGSGKITFFNVLSGILPATAGKVFFRGEDVTRLRVHAMTGRGMARTFQNIRLFQNLTAHDNVVLGRYTRTESGLWDGVVRSPRPSRSPRHSRRSSRCSRTSKSGSANWPARCQEGSSRCWRSDAG